MLWTREPLVISTHWTIKFKRNNKKINSYIDTKHSFVELFLKIVEFCDTEHIAFQQHAFKILF